MDEKYHSAKRAAVVLERAYKLVIALKTSRDGNPLSVVVLDELEDHLSDVRSIMVDLERETVDGASAWKLLSILFGKLVKCAINLFGITQHCYQYLCERILIYENRVFDKKFT